MLRGGATSRLVRGPCRLHDIKGLSRSIASVARLTLLSPLDCYRLPQARSFGLHTALCSRRSPAFSLSTATSQAASLFQKQTRCYAGNQQKKEWTNEEIREYLKSKLSAKNFAAWEAQQNLTEEQKQQNLIEGMENIKYLSIMDRCILAAEEELKERSNEMFKYYKDAQLLQKRPPIHPNSVLDEPLRVPNHDPRNAISYEKDFAIDFEKENIFDPKFKALRIELGLDEPSRSAASDIYAPRLAKASRTRTFAMAQSHEEQEAFEQKAIKIRDLPPIEYFFPVGTPKDTDPKTLPALEEMPPFWPTVKYWKSMKPSEESLRKYAEREAIPFETMKQLSERGLVDIELMKLSLGDEFRPEKKETEETETEQFSEHINKILYHGLEKKNEYVSAKAEWKLDEWYEYMQFMHEVARNAEKLARVDQNLRIAKRFRKPVVFDRDFDYDALKAPDQQRPPGWEEPKVVLRAVKEEKPHGEIEDLAVMLHELHLEVQQNPQDAVVYLRRGMLLYDIGKPSEAAEDFTRVITLNHWNPEIPSQAQYFRALAWEELGRFEEALQSYNEIIEAVPHHYDAFISRALLLHEEYNNAERAIADLDRAIALNEENPAPWMHRAQIRFNQGEYKKSLQDVDMYNSLAPQSPDGYLLRGNIYMKLNKFDKAVQDFSILIEVDQNRLDIGVTGEDMESWTYRGLYNRAVVFARIGDLRNAMRDISIVIQRAPTFQLGLNLHAELSKLVTPEAQ